MVEITQQSKIFAIKLKVWREEAKKKVWEPGMQGMGGRVFGFRGGGGGGGGGVFWF